MKAQFFIVIVSALLVIAGGWVTLAEVAPYFEVRNSPAQRFAAARNAVPRYGLSYKSQFLALNDCSRNVSGRYAKTQPTDQHDAMLENCGQLAKEIIARSPADGFAWYLFSQVSAQTGDFDLFNTALLQSQSLTPNEQWVAELRVYAFEGYYENLLQEAKAAEQKDLALLVVSKRGVNSIAARYVSDTAFRERITALVEKLPPHIQTKFVRYVRAAANKT